LIPASTSGDLERLLSAWLPEQHRADREAIAAAARHHRLLATLASAWRDEDKPLGPTLAEELRQHEARLQRYQRLAGAMTATHGGVHVRKGPSVSAVYPPAWVRSSNDLDVEVSTTAEVIAVGRWLVEQHWRVTRLVVFRAADGVRLAIDLTRPPDPNDATGPFRPDLVQVQGFAFRGQATGLRPRVRFRRSEELSDAERSLVDIAESVAHRPMLARDVLDTRLVAARLTEDGRRRVTDAMLDLALWPEWKALCGAAEVPCPARPLATALCLTSRTLLGWVDERRRRAALARQYALGLPLAGTPAGVPSSDFTVRREGAGALRFASPFGEGELTTDG
jgi:hypothetical protein